MQMDRAMHRALVEAGFAPLDEYLARWAPTPAKGNPAMKSQDPRALPEWLQREADERDQADRDRRGAFLTGLLVLVCLVALFAIFAVPAIADWVEHRAAPAWEGNR